MRRLLAGITFVAALVFVAGETPTHVEGATLVSPAEAKVLWDKGIKFIDVRGNNVFSEGHIPGAVALDYIGAFTQDSLKKVAKLSDPIVIHCSGPG